MVWSSLEGRVHTAGQAWRLRATRTAMYYDDTDWSILLQVNFTAPYCLYLLLLVERTLRTMDGVFFLRSAFFALLACVLCLIRLDVDREKRGEEREREGV